MSYKWGLRPLSDSERLVEGRLKEVSTCERGSSDKDGNYTPARIQIAAKDTDALVRTALGSSATRNFINRYGRYDILSYDNRKLDLTPRPIIQGRVVSLNPTIGRNVTIEIQDIVGSNFGPLDPQKKIGILIGDEQPGKPDSSKGKIYNIIIGHPTDGALTNTDGTSAAQGVIPPVDCGNIILDPGSPASNPDPSGRTFNTGFTPVIDQANVNLIPGGDITYTTFSCVSRILGTEMGPPSSVIVLDPDGNGAGGPSDAHTHKHVWMGNGVADSFIVWFFTNPAFHPINNPAGDPDARYKIISGTPTNPAWPPNTPTWEFECDFTTREDGSVWGSAAATPASTKVWFAVALGEVADFDVYGPDMATIDVDNVTPKRRLYAVDGDGISTPDSVDWPHAERYRVVGGIRQSGFYVDLGPVLDAVRANKQQFACNVCGMMGSNGLVIDQAWIQLLFFLNEIIELNDGTGYRDGASPSAIELFPDGTPKFWTSKFLDAQQLTMNRMGTDKGRLGVIVITEQTELREVLRKFFLTHGGHLTSDTHGRIYPFLIDVSLATGGPIYRMRMEIKRLIQHWYAYDETENRIRYKYFYDWSLGDFRKPETLVENTQSITDHGGEEVGVFQTFLKECFYCQDEASIIDRWAYELSVYSYPPRYAKWATDMAALEVHNGDRLRFSHAKEGVGATGDIATRGFQMKSEVSIQPYEVIQTARLLDPTITAAVWTAAGSGSFTPKGAIKDAGVASFSGSGAASWVGDVV